LAIFFPEKEIPKVVRLLGRYDVWDHSNSDVLPFQYGIRLNVTYPKNQDLWKSYFEVSDNIDIIQKTIEKGKIILEYQKQENEKYAKSCAFEIEFEGYRAICVNKLMANSQLFDSVWDPNRHDLMIQFGIRKNGIWTMSFYTKKITSIVQKLLRNSVEVDMLKQLVLALKLCQTNLLIKLNFFKRRITRTMNENVEKHNKTSSITNGIKISFNNFIESFKNI